MQGRRAVYGRLEATVSQGELGDRSVLGLTASSLQSVSVGRVSSSWNRALVMETATSSSKQSHTAFLKNSTLLEGAVPVLDREGIKILPGSAVVVEGQSLQLTCVASQLLKHRQQDAPYMAFQFPSMADTFKNRVTMTLRPGVCVLPYKP